MVEEMLATRGICVTYETVRQWGKKFGARLSPIRDPPARAPARGDKWHMDEGWSSRSPASHTSALARRRSERASFSTSWSNVEEASPAAAQRLMKRLLKSAIIPAPRHDHWTSSAPTERRGRRWAFKLNIESTKD